MEGHLFTSMILEDILVEHDDGSIFLAKSIESTMNFFPLLTGVISLDLIKINDTNKERYFLVYQNFKKILKWNTSNYFAIAVGVLSDSININ